MIRDRAWRRHIEEKYIVKRLKIISRYRYWSFEDVNGIEMYNTRFINFLGKKEYFESKTISTNKYTTRSKCKYSPNYQSKYWRDKKVRSESTGLREKDKVLFLKILKENGIK